MPAQVIWTWHWGPPGTANLRGFGDNIWFDIIRLVLIILSVCLAWICFRIMVEQRRRPVEMSRYQEMRFVSLALMALALATTEAWLMGTTATPRLFVHMACVMTGLYGVYGKRRQQKREEIPDIGDLT